MPASERKKNFIPWFRIDPDLLSVVTTSAIDSNTDKYWDTIWKQYHNSNAPNEKTTLLMALCSTPKKEKIMW